MMMQLYKNDKLFFFWVVGRPHEKHWHAMIPVDVGIGVGVGE